MEESIYPLAVLRRVFSTSLVCDVQEHTHQFHVLHTMFRQMLVNHSKFCMTRERMQDLVFYEWIQDDDSDEYVSLSNTHTYLSSYITTYCTRVNELNIKVHTLLQEDLLVDVYKWVDGQYEKDPRRLLFYILK